MASISGYRIIEQIGEGGMSRVYLADDTRHDRRLVLKVFDPRASDAAQWLLDQQGRDRLEALAKAVL